MQTLDDPQWAGKISIADPRGGAALNTLTVMDKLWGDDPIKKLMAQKPVVTGEPRQQMDWLASGRYPIAFGMPSITFWSNISSAARRSTISKKVLGMHIWSPGVGAIQYLAKAPHPRTPPKYS